MKKNILVLTIILIIISGFSAYGAFLKNVPQSLEQPDGSKLNCLATGDEFHNWLHDDDNYTIIRHPQTGFFVYAVIIEGQLSASEWIAGEVDPSSIGLEPGINISYEEYLEKKRKKTQFPGFKSHKATSNIGSLENLVVFIRFQNQSEYTENKSYYDNAFNGTNVVSMNSYYDVVSDNQLEINSHLFPRSNGTTVVSYQDSHPRSYFQPYNFVSNPGGYSNDNEYASREHTLLKNATDFVQGQIEGLNLDLDMDNDGNVDNIVYVIQGKTDGWSDLLWPHKWAMFNYDIYLNGSKIWWYNFQLSEAFNVSVLCHEMFHSLGAPDLYRYKDRNLTPVGPWDLMAETTTPPQHMGVYMKMKYGGWINSIPTITAGGTYTLESLSNNPFAAYKIQSPNSTSEYFVVEYRHKTGQFESSLPGSGLIIYRVKPSIDGNAEGPPDEVYTFRPNGTTTANGDIYKAYFSSQASKTRFDDNSNPSCFLSNGASGGIKIENIGSAGTTISFDVVMGSSFQAPRNLTASAAGNSVGLKWQKPMDGNGSLIGYKVFRNDEMISTINNPSTLAYTDNGLANGRYNYHLKAIYTSPTGESSGSNVATASIGVSGKADLLINNAVVSPTTVEPGGSINITCKLVNDGDIQAGGSILRLFLSRDQQFDSGDISIAYGSMDPIGAGNYSDITGNDLSIPEDTGSGSWYVLFIADADGHVDESNEGNNQAVRLLTVNSSGFEPPRNLTASASGNAVNLSWQAPLSGEGTHTGYKVYRNNNPITTLTNSGASSYTDSGLANGSYTYFVTATYSSPSGESRGSNEASINITSETKPDLIISNPSVSITSLESGGTFDIACKYENTGTARAGESMLRLFFSTDQRLDEADVHFAYGAMDPVDPGNSMDITGEGLTVPSGLESGSWYVLFVADADENVNELNEVNNISAVGVTILSEGFYPPENLNGLVYGSTVELFWDTPKGGSANLTGFKVYRNNILVNTMNDPGLLEFADEDLSLGTYTYYVTAKYSSPVGESEKSNPLSLSITSSGRADLTIINQMVSPDVVDPGDYVSIACDLTNNGTVTAGESVLRLFFSRDEIWDNQDIEMAYGALGELDPGYYFPIEGDDILIPTDLPQGLWQVLFIADADEHVTESIESNNISIFEITVGSTSYSPPRNLKAVVTGRDISLSWNPPVSGNGVLTGYNVYRNNSFVALVNNPDELSFLDSGLDAGTYQYFLTANYINPIGESGASNQVSATITVADKPDLVITDPMLSPVKIEVGGMFDISCRLSNVGTSEAGSSTILLVVSKDQNVDSGDIGLAYGTMDPIGAGEYSDVTGSDLELPEEIDSGNWYVAFIADADLEVDESNENNNVVFVSLEVESAGFMPPRNLNASVSGSNVVLNWQTPEQGYGTLSAYRIYRNGTQIYQLNDPSANSFSDNNLDIGSYTYFVTAVYQSPSGESSSSNSVSLEITSTGEPDLVITDSSVSPVEIEPGGLVSVNCMLRNRGSTTAGESMMRLFISDDDVVSSDDEEVASGDMGLIDAGGFIEVSGEDLELPSTLASGVWYMIFVADADGEVPESNEQNNTSIIAVSVGESIFNPPLNLRGSVSGSTIELFWDQPEQSLAELIGYKLYRNGAFYNSLSLTANQGFIDGSLEDITYSYTVSAEYANPAGESSHSNEVVITISPILQADLTIRNSVVFPTNLDPGGVVSISCDLMNIGNAQAGNSYLRLYLSKNEVLDNSDQLLAYGSMDPMDPGSSFSITGEDLAIPADLAPGEWFVFFVADADQEVVESNEDNNAQIVQIGVASKRPDLVPTRLYLIRDYTNPGDMMRLTLFIYNDGQGVSVPSVVSFYLSEDETLDDQDVYLNSVTIKKMLGGEQMFKNNYVTIPESTIRKQYYLFAYLDVNQDVAETDEDNNAFSVRITVGSSGISDTEIAEYFKIYPVPASHEVFFEFKGSLNEPAVINVYDQIGRVIYNDRVEDPDSWTRRLDVSAWQKGFYTAKISSGGKQYVTSFIKL